MEIYQDHSTLLEHKQSHNLVFCNDCGLLKLELKLFELLKVNSGDNGRITWVLSFRCVIYFPP